MRKQPFIFSFLKCVALVGICFLLLMIYWSSLIVEQELFSVKNELHRLDKEIQDTRSMLDNLPTDGVRTVNKQSLNTLKNADKDLANLLVEDPFYLKTLPEMLGSGFQPHGVRQMAVMGRPENLHPFSNWAQVATWNDLCLVSLAKNDFGKYESFAPDMAVKIEERVFDKERSPEYWIHLRDGVFWEPLSQAHFPDHVKLAPHFLKKHQVTAHDFKFYYDAIMNPHVEQAQAVALRNYYDDVEEVRVVDDLTLVVRWKDYQVEENGKMVPKKRYVAKQLTGSLKPLASFVYQYFSDGNKIVSNDTDPHTYKDNLVWAQNFAQHWAQNVIVSCGSVLFDGMSERQIRFRRNPRFYFPYAMLMSAIEVQFKSSVDSIWNDFKTNQIDSYGIQPEQLSELQVFLDSPLYQEQKAAGGEVKKLEYLARLYGYIGWNQARPYFSTPKLRQAMTMAIDRNRIISHILNGMGVEITGTFFYRSSAYDHSIEPWPFDPVQARSLLEEEGWFDLNGDGVLAKEIDGVNVPFRFSLIYYVKNQMTKVICEYVATALKQIGVDCTLNGVDLPDISAVFDDKNFDALCMGWGLSSPPEDPKQLWSSSGAHEKGSSNVVGFANKEADEIIHQLDYESDPKKREILYHRFDKILHEEAPYTFLYTPKAIMLYREYLQNVFIPADRQDLVPGADVSEPDSSIYWLKK